MRVLEGELAGGGPAGAGMREAHGHKARVGVGPPPVIRGRFLDLVLPQEAWMEGGRPEAASSFLLRHGDSYFTRAMAVLTLRLVASSPGRWPWKSNASSTPGRNTRQWVEPPKWNMPS